MMRGTSRILPVTKMGLTQCCQISVLFPGPFAMVSHATPAPARKRNDEFKFLNGEGTKNTPGKNKAHQVQKLDHIFVIDDG